MRQEDILYPGLWAGQVPDDFHSLAQGKSTIRLNQAINIDYMQHLSFPRIFPEQELKILDPCCGTGEDIICMALKYPKAKFAINDPEPQALELTEQYRDLLGIKNMAPEDDADKYHIIRFTRKLDQLDDIREALEKAEAKLAPGGALQIRGIIKLTPSEEALRQAWLGSELQLTAEDLIDRLRDLPEDEGIDDMETWLGFFNFLAQVGLEPFRGLHPWNYQVKAFQELRRLQTDAEDWPWQEEARLVYILTNTLTELSQRHYWLCCRLGETPQLPAMDDPLVKRVIPHQSPFMQAFEDEGHVIIGQGREHLILDPRIEVEAVRTPPHIVKIYQTINGSLNFEQLHRRFLPMSWDSFWHFMNNLYDCELIHLHV